MTEWRMPALPAPRRFILLALATMFAWLAAAPASALEPPTGRVLLTITGDIAERNSPDGATFDLAMLEKLPQHSFSTKTPWYSRPRKFTGVTLRDLLAAVGAKGGIAHAVALNDYRVDIAIDEAVRDGMLVAYRLDGDEMPVRSKGPLVLIYPFDDRPELRTALHYGRAAWQLTRLELR